MSKPKKVLLGIAIFFVAVFFGGLMWYMQTGNYYAIQLGLRAVEIQGKLKMLRQNKYCAGVDNKPECFQAFITANEQVKFSTDLPLYTIAAFSVCGDNNTYCVYESTNKAILAVDIHKLWLLENIKTRDKEFKLIYRQEVKMIDKFLRNYRKKLVEQYAVEIDPTKKTSLVDFVKQVDLKITAIQAKL